MALNRRRPGGGIMPAQMFDPKNYSASSYIDPIARLRDLSQSYQANPGRMAGGSGSTGLASNDGAGWSRMLEEQQEFQRLSNFADGQSPELNTRVNYNGGTTRTIPTATGENNSAAFGVGPTGPLPASVGGSDIQGAMDGIRQATPNYESHGQFMGRYGRKAR